VWKLREVLLFVACTINWLVQCVSKAERSLVSFIHELMMAVSCVGMGLYHGILAGSNQEWDSARWTTRTQSSDVVSYAVNPSLSVVFMGNTSHRLLSLACRARDYVYIDCVRHCRSSSCRLLRPINCQTYITLHFSEIYAFRSFYNLFAWSEL